MLLQGNPPAVTNDTGLWRRAWTGLDLKHTITPVTVQDLKPEIHADTVSMLLAGDGNGLRILNDEYGTKLIVMAVAEPDMVAKKLTVTLAGQDAVGPLLLKRTYRMTNGDLGYTSELAAVIALGVLEGRWKAIKSAACTTGVDRRAGLVGLDGWRRRRGAVYGIIRRSRAMERDPRPAPRHAGRRRPRNCHRLGPRCRRFAAISGRRQRPSRRSGRSRLKPCNTLRTAGFFVQTIDNKRSYLSSQRSLPTATEAV